MNYAKLYKELEGTALWCAVYDGPVAWEGRTAFEQIDHLERIIKRLTGTAPSERYWRRELARERV